MTAPTAICRNAISENCLFSAPSEAQIKEVGDIFFSLGNNEELIEMMDVDPQHEEFFISMIALNQRVLDAGYDNYSFIHLGEAIQTLKTHPLFKQFYKEVE